MSSWHSYPSIYNFGHKAIIDLLRGEVNVEEKVDGSQFSFGLVETEPGDTAYSPDDRGLSLRVRSKGAVMHVDAPESLFKEAVEAVKAVQDKLHPGWTYRGECLKKPKHNSLAYDRIPQNHIIIFDVNTGEESYLDYDAKRAEADRLGFETVPCLYTGRITSPDEFRRFLDTTSVLGGQRIEGVVVKPIGYDLYGRDKKVLMGKFVSEAFKEVHRKAWAESNPTGGDIINQIVANLSVQARWNKALIHLRERGLITDTVQDIGALIREIPEDVKKEELDQIKDWLFAWAWPHIKRGIGRGVPEWYKDILLKRQFEEQGNENS